MASKDKAFYSKNTFCANGNLIDLTIPKIMGILNITDDSFYDGGRFVNEKEIYVQTEKLIEDGADIIDLGGYSSRPGAKHISVELEIERVKMGLRIVRSISKNIPVSVDTFRSSVARNAVECGADIINDISGGNLDDNMFKTISELKVPYVLMHMVGNPQNMDQNTSYDHFMVDIINYFSKKLKQLTQIGIKDVIIDVGFGFSKTIPQNYTLLSNLACFQMLNTPLLVGISRKSMIYKLLESTADNALNGTSVLNAISIIKGAKILRVHDVKFAKEVITLTNMIEH